MTVEMRTPSVSPPKPGLAALVVYLRPAPRGRLLRLLADLGVFVIEHQGGDDARQTAMSTRSDFVIVVGDDHPTHASIAGELLTLLSSILVAILPSGSDTARYHAAGATVMIRDDVTDEDFGPLLRPAVRQARFLRDLGRMAAEYIVFSDIRFRTSPPELARGGSSIGLTRVECEVLSLLSRSIERPVATTDIEQKVAALSTRTELHAGYVKTIILRIRRKVAELGGDPERLRSVRGVGYVLTG